MSNIICNKEVNSVDWTKCILCQIKTNEDLQCPGTVRPNNTNEIGYVTLANDLQKFNELNHLPLPIEFDLLDEGLGIAETLSKHKAKWHKLCRNKFSKIKLQRIERRKSLESGLEPQMCTPAKITRKSSGDAVRYDKGKCFFCNTDTSQLHQVTTFEMDRTVRQYAHDIQDTILLAKLSGGDLISQEAVYHLRCYRELYHKARSLTKNDDTNIGDSQLHGIALAELISYIDDCHCESEKVQIFKLSELARLYTDRLQQLGVHSTISLNVTHLKNRILANIPDLEAYKQGREVHFVFNEDLENLLKKATCFDDDAVILSKAANIVRKDIFEHEEQVFNGTFDKNCQDMSVPQCLKSLVAMILGGPNIETQSGKIVEAQAVLSIAQLLRFNVAVRRRKNSSNPYHLKQHETPLPMYIGMLIHAETRKRGLIDKLNDLGVSVSYSRVLELSTQLGNSVCTRYEQQNIVCPSSLRHGIFTTGAVDNIDHNPSSTTAQGSFHGTGISVFQHPRSACVGEVQDIDTQLFSEASKRSLGQLPEEYRCVPPASITAPTISIPPVESPIHVECQQIPAAIKSQYMWLEYVRTSIMSDGEDLDLSWAAYHSKQTEEYEERPIDISTLLPLFEEQAKSVAMIKHSMTIIRQITHYLNQGQTPIIACDQPLYAISKQIQWTWPDQFGEHCYVVMFGGLHIEIAALKALGSWLENSGWTSALEQANVASPGTADSFLKASHVGRTFYAHQVTACSLYALMQRAFLAKEVCYEEGTTLEEWRSKMESNSPMFKFWSITLRFEVTVLTFMKALREGNFFLYREAIVSLVPWFFSLDHPNYARWLPVHIRDMALLEQRNPDVVSQFAAGKFVVHKTQHTFSAIALDHAHEQNNKLIKGDGGAVGLTENSSQLMRWMVSGPEIARLVNEFQSSVDKLKQEQSKGPDIRHHEQQTHFQNRFRNHVQSLCDKIQDMGNPFLDTSGDLMALDSRNIVDESVAETVRQIEQKGQDQYKKFVSERLEKRDKQLSETIKQNKFPLFSRQYPKQLSKDKQHISYLKQDCSLFSRLYVSCQVRNGNLEEFFAHENSTFPPSLSQFGSLRFGTKSDLVSCLETHSQVKLEVPEVDAVALDGAVIVNMLKPTGCQSFQDYADFIFKPYLRHQLSSVRRLDIVWDVYDPNSLKSATRSQRGKGVRRRVLPDSKIPGNWDSFLRVNENKTELFNFLGKQAVDTSHGGKLVVSTLGRDVVSSSESFDTSRLAPCDHEEADVKLMLHLADIAVLGYKRIMIRTVDTDVLVLAVAVYPQILVEELWIAFGAGKNLRFIAVHTIVDSLGESKARALPAFHAFTGCDQTSAFCGRGKKSAWETWTRFSDVTESFSVLSSLPTIESVQDQMPKIERFVVLLYDRTCPATGVNEARKRLFTQKGRSIECVPPSSASLFEHSKRVAYQAGYIWGQALKPQPEIPSPSQWGWTRGISDKWEPFWSALPQAAVSCQELLKCGCNPDKGCLGRCKCQKAEMLCTALCKCGGNCDRG